MRGLGIERLIISIDQDVQEKQPEREIEVNVVKCQNMIESESMEKK